MMRPARERGVILISALIIVAAATIIAAALFFDTGLTARRSIGNQSFEQAMQIARGAEALAGQVLSEDRDQTDTPQDSWAQQVEPMEVEVGIRLEARLTDLSGKFNVNTLVNADGTRNENAGKVFTRLLQLAELDERWTDMVADWIDPDTQPAPDGGEDGLYLSQKPAHRAANLTITSLSELLQLPGFTREMYKKLAVHATALPPTANTINVCTADGVVLDALFALHENDAGHVEYSTLRDSELEERRGGSCYPKRSAITDGQQAMQQATSEKSSWFQLESWVDIGSAQFALYSLLQRDGSGQARVVARSLGND